HLPPAAFPLVMALAQDAPVLEVLLEESAAKVEGAKLVSRGSVSQEGRVFQRWIATDVAANATLRISVPPPAVAARRQRMLLVQLLVLGLGALMILAFARSFARRPERLAFGQRHLRAPLTDLLARVPPEGAESPEMLARAVAELDRRFERMRAPSDAERAAYTDQREALKRRLARALEAARSAR
ncbi:MAG: hypothetical protein ACR2OG_16990, partial [Gemmatimonadaceae bacterium]